MRSIALIAAALLLSACGHHDSAAPATNGWWCYEFRSPQIAAGVCVRERDACEHARQRQGDCEHSDVASCYRTPDGDDCAPSMDECAARSRQTSTRDGNAAVAAPCAELR